MNAFVSVDPHKLDEAMEKRFWTMTKLSNAAKVSYSCIRGIMSGRQENVRKITAAKIAAALGVETADIL